MTTPRTVARSRIRRGLAVLLVGTVTAALAIGPSNVAGALGLSTAADPESVVGFLPAPSAVDVKSPTLTLYGLSHISTDDPIPVVGGSSPSDTVLLVFDHIALDNLSIIGDQGGAELALQNAGTAAEGDEAVIGSSGGTVHLWGELNTLCMNLSDALGTIGGSLLSSLSTVLSALTKLLSATNGACLPLTVSTLKLLAPIVNAGALKSVALRASNLDIDVYALDVVPGSGSAVDLPVGSLKVTG